MCVLFLCLPWSTSEGARFMPKKRLFCLRNVLVFSSWEISHFSSSFTNSFQKAPSLMKLRQINSVYSDDVKAFKIQNQNGTIT